MHTFIHVFNDIAPHIRRCQKKFNQDIPIIDGAIEPGVELKVEKIME